MLCRKRLSCEFAGIVLASLFVCAAARADDLQSIVIEDFEQGDARWKPTDAAAWRIADSPQGKVYQLFQQSKYEPPFRSPVNFALLDDVVVGSFVLEVKLQSTVKDYNHRSMVLVFGYQDPSHFYYVHFGKKTDDHANQIFIVNGTPRTKISQRTTPGTPWDDAWHRVKIVRSARDGRTAVFFDDLDNPAMTAVDTTFAWGQIGLGAFDDLGNFDDVALSGAIVERPKP